ncbi:MAG: hypothetical protein H0W25_10860 [Acidimicrobiia bacterium]|nr:hypothetical protein [Acidimicrobiia bacterium]
MFEAIGDQIQTEIPDIRDQLMGPSRPGENLLDLQRRSAESRATAEELVLANHWAFQPEPDLTPQDQATDPGLLEDPGDDNQSLHEPSI